MSVKTKTLLRSNFLSRAGAWEFNPDLESLNIISSPIRSRKKVNLRRGKNFTSTKTCNISSRIDTRMQSSCEIDRRKFDMKKLRNAKELVNCRSARSHSAGSVKDKQIGECPTTVRTRSVSPTPSTPPVNFPLTKFYSHFAKIIDQLEIIKIFTNRQLDTAESLQELNRQKKRATEFAVRFSRNNIYQMKRVVSEIKQIIVPYPFDNLAKSDGEILCKKMLVAYQTAVQAFQTCINYMKSGQSLNVPEKIRELVLLVVDLHLCCEHLSIPKDQIDLLTPCRELIVLLDGKIAEANGKAPATRQNEKVKGSGKEEKRFSMYKTKLTNSGWKKKTEALAKVKFGVPKLSYIKKLKKMEEKTVVPSTTLEIYSQKRQLIPCKTISGKNVTDDNKKGTKTCNLRASSAFKKSHRTPREVTSQDDDIETVVQSIDDEEVMLSSAGFPTPSEITSGVFYRDRSDSSFGKPVSQAVREIRNAEHGRVKNLTKSLSHRANPTPPPKNVKFIHMISNEPIPEEQEEDIDRDLGNGANNNKVEVITENREQCHKPQHGEWKTVSQQATSQPEQAAACKGKFMKVPKETTKAMLHYKKMLCEYRKNNVMYRKGINVKPLELVLRISDQIIDDILFEVSSGMESENLLDQLYRNELLEVT